MFLLAVPPVLTLSPFTTTMLLQGRDGTVVPDVSHQLAKAFEASSRAEADMHMQRSTHGLRSFGGSSHAAPNLAELRQLIIAAGSHWR